MKTSETKGRPRHWVRRSRNCRKQRRGFFKKGNTFHRYGDLVLQRDASDSVPSTSDHSINIEHVEHVEDSLPKMRQRISGDLHHVARNPQTPDVQPSNLRPYASFLPQQSGKAERLTGNIITDVGKFELNFNKCIRDHFKMFPGCIGDIVFDPHAFHTWGLGVSSRLKCTGNCGFLSNTMKFYQEVQHRGRGRRAAKINMQLQVVLTKHPIGNSAIRELLSAIDTPCPSESGMQKNANKVSDAFHDIAKEELRKNRALVKTVMELRGCDEARVVAQSDVAYNNPIKGRSFYQPGTQAWAPCFVCEPGLGHIPIAFQTRSKVCSCLPKNEILKHRDDCKLDFPADQAMGNAEFQLGRDLGRELIEGDAPLGVHTLVTDGDSHLYKGMREIMSSHGVITEKGDCTRHITRSISRNISKGTLSERCFREGKTRQQKSSSQRTLANFIERRCSMEFRAAYRKHGGHFDKLVKACKLAKIGILGCIQGHPDICRHSSLVCGAHRWKSGDKPPPGLPDHRYVQLSKSDARLIEKWIDNKLSPTAVRGQKDNVTTNRSEASHLTVLRGLPKCRNHRRNYSGRAKSGVHSMSMGVMDSIETANRILGADNTNDCPASRTRGQIRNRYMYQMERRKSVAYKASKFASVRRKRNSRQFTSNGYSSGVQDPTVRQDHSY